MVPLWSCTSAPVAPVCDLFNTSLPLSLSSLPLEPVVSERWIFSPTHRSQLPFSNSTTVESSLSSNSRASHLEYLKESFRNVSFREKQDLLPRLDLRGVMRTLHSLLSTESQCQSRWNNKSCMGCEICVRLSVSSECLTGTRCQIKNIHKEGIQFSFSWPPEGT